MKYTLELKSLPFEPLRSQIIYVENSYDEVVNKFIQDNYEKICLICSAHDLEFCYLPKLNEQPVEEDVLFYNAPYANPQEEHQPIGSDFLLHFMATPGNRELIPPSLLYLDSSGRIKSDSGVVTFNGMSVTEQDVYPHVEDIFFLRLKEIFWEKEEDKNSHDRIMFSKEASDDVGPRFSKENKKFDKPVNDPYNDRYFFFGEPEESSKFNRTADQRFDEESKQIADEIKERIKKLEKKGISRLMVIDYLMANKPLSRLYITKDFHIFLPDYNNIEITMTPLPKALFLLFLRHPEGIIFSYMPDYRKELQDIYMAVKGSDVLSESELKSIERVADKFDNSINEKCSRIREAFIRHFAEHLAKNYFVTGKRGEPKKITLPRNLVVWE